MLEAMEIGFTVWFFGLVVMFVLAVTLDLPKTNHGDLAGAAIIIWPLALFAILVIALVYGVKSSVCFLLGKWTLVWRSDRDRYERLWTSSIEYSFEKSEKILKLEKEIERLKELDKIHNEQAQSYLKAQQQVEEELATIKAEFRHKIEQLNKMVG